MVKKGKSPRVESPGIQRALLQERVGDRVRCVTCERRCLLKDGALGWCRTRKNDGGTLYTLIYGLVSSLSANPIEKKPIYHLHPGSVALTAGSWSCNFKCPWCQNSDISKRPPSGGRYMSAEEFVAQAIAWRCQGTSISFNEPTLSLEWSLDIFPLARERGLYNTYVTNGYMTPEALDLLVEAGLDAMNVDVKGSARAVKKYCAADVEKVWRNCQAAREAGVWVEITTLVIPTVNDDEGALRGIARRIRDELGSETPWHVSGYYPAYKFTAPPTPVRTLERAHDIGMEEGLNFVYVGNVLGHRYENTYCPDCGELLIQRFGLRVAQNRLDGARCPVCQRLVPMADG
jgi:pyruvate formate lyase activating enzyme